MTASELAAGFGSAPASSTEDQIGDLLFPLPLDPFQSMLDGLASTNSVLTSWLTATVVPSNSRLLSVLAAGLLVLVVAYDAHHLRHLPRFVLATVLLSVAFLFLIRFAARSNILGDQIRARLLRLRPFNPNFRSVVKGALFFPAALIWALSVIMAYRFGVVSETVVAPLILLSQVLLVIGVYFIVRGLWFNN